MEIIMTFATLTALKKIHLAAADIGAGSGRVISAAFDGESLFFEEVHRFNNSPVKVGTTLYWDVLYIVDELYRGFGRAAAKNGANIDCIGVDTWGADFGLIDRYGNLLTNPVCYRDERLKKNAERAGRVLSHDELNNMNTSKTYYYCALFRLFHLYQHEIEIARLVKLYLPIPNLINYFLTRIPATEASVLTGTQFFDVKTRMVLYDVLELFGVPSKIIPGVEKQGTVIGPVQKSLNGYTGLTRQTRVAMVCGHDTASAVSGIPIKRRPSYRRTSFRRLSRSTSNSRPSKRKLSKSCFLICGTWSVLGTETKAPVAPEALKGSDFTNWCGYRTSNLFVKIFSSFYFLQECKKEWEIDEGRALPYEDLYSDLLSSDDEESVVDLKSGLLADTHKPMLESIRNYFQRTAQKANPSRINITAALLRSIVLETTLVVEELEKHLNVVFESIYMVGGGSRIELFCQWTADCTGKLIVAGSPEATVLGNIVVQLIALGELGSLDEGRELILRSSTEKYYSPSASSLVNWEKLTEKYISLKNGLLL
jgi:sugar (pentulose or hexulose) kinase